MRVCVGIATTGRAEVVDKTAQLWAAQTRPFDRMVICGAGEQDMGPGVRAMPKVETVIGPKGLCSQRNTILNTLNGDCDVVVFADDDYVPSRFFLERTVGIFEANPDIVALTGNVLADGIGNSGIPFESAVETVAAHDAAGPPAKDGLRRAASTYGCNMAFRVSAAPDLRFDERLPLYAWQEDVDFSVRMGRHGRIVYAHSVAGVHMGTKGGRVSGVRFGYSQIANPLYLMGKGSMSPGKALPLMARNVTMNIMRSFAPEPWVDRKGRLWGNVVAVADGLIGRQRPERILDL